MRYTASEISEKLAAQVENVCQHLLPGGKKVNGEWRTGDLSGGKGDSLGVRLAGGKAGVWSDFACGTDKGDLLDLWAAVKGLTLGKAIVSAKDWLGIAPAASVLPAKKYPKPAPKNIFKVTSPEAEKVFTYLTRERLLELDTIKAFKVAQRGNDIAFPSFSPDGKMVNIKYINLERDARGKKIVTQETGCAPALFGWQTVDPKNRTCIITEGQIDAMTWYQWSGMNALSIPNGTGDLNNWIDYEWDNLAAFDCIYLSFDNDEKGLPAIPIVAKRLGIHRCKIVTLPFKDANEALQKGFNGGQAAEALKAAKVITPEEIKSPDDFRGAIHKFFHPVEGDNSGTGLKVPILGSRFAFRPGELTLWTGHTSHGKSSMLSQVVLYAALAGQRIAIGSFEMKGYVLLAKKISCMSFNAKPDPIEINQVIDWMQQKIWIYNIIGQVTKAKLEELMLYSMMRHGVNHYVIDSLMKCAISSEDYEAQRQFISFLHSFAIENGIHIHLVSHPRKDKDDLSEVGIYDVHGGNTITSQPDNIISVYRNRKKDKLIKENKTPDHILKNEPEAIVSINKQRLTGEEYKTSLYFDRKIGRFSDVPDVYEDWTNAYRSPQIEGMRET